MDKDWIKAVTLLCIIAQNNADSMKQSVRYAEIMKKEYGLDAEKFQWIYDSWFRRKNTGVRIRLQEESKNFLCITKGQMVCAGCSKKVS